MACPDPKILVSSGAGQRRALFLDLEDTVIEPVSDGWVGLRAMNLHRLDAVVERFAPTELHLFSFAVHTPQDLLSFERHVKDWLERRVGLEFTTALATPEIISKCARQRRIAAELVTFSEVVDFWGKQEAFRLFLKTFAEEQREPGVDLAAVLLDDSVFNETFSWPDLAVSAMQLCVDDVPPLGWGS